MIANHLHLLTLLGQVVEGLQVLQPNRVFAMPKSHNETEIIHCAEYFKPE
ncbi:hypothetical protein [Nostoc sp.]